MILILTHLTNQLTLPADKLKPMDPSSREAVADMIRLVELHEGSLLYNIKQRYKKNHIYVRVLLYKISAALL